jgi:type II secretory pathway pseudopilin PulG
MRFFNIPDIPRVGYPNHPVGGFTFLELLLFLVIISSLTVLVWPRFGRVIENQHLSGYKNAVSKVATQAWRHAQIQGKDTHIVFNGGSSSVVWKEGNIRIRFPYGFTTDSSAVWVFPRNGYPNNSTVTLVCGTDSLLVPCVINKVIE